MARSTPSPFLLWSPPPAHPLPFSSHLHGLGPRVQVGPGSPSALSVPFEGRLSQHHLRTCALPSALTHMAGRKYLSPKIAFVRAEARELT
uniref:Uncharacterized protein n=1 Tax=Rangifer tarandus platyrhynchus TaxID=3082113 RepID=A0ACB0F277_RANTA|nr:unnamed protein product [Rangifer tarandus platyrhynchus]